MLAEAVAALVGVAPGVLGDAQHFVGVEPQLVLPKFRSRNHCRRLRSPFRAITPGITILPSGNFIVSNNAHS
jgi:hypothetical protein